MKALLALCAVVASIATAQPNIVYICADDLGWGELGCYGNPQVITPNIDQLAAEGMLFTNYNTCAAVCSPNRAAYLSGTFPAELGINNVISGNPSKNAGWGQIDALPAVASLLPRQLQTLGYTTGHFGKWHLGIIGDIPLADYGFDEHRSTLSGASNPHYTTNAAWNWDSDRQIADDAIAFMQDHYDDEEPFYLQIMFKTPHSTLDPTATQAARYTGNVTAEEPVNGWTSGRHARMSAITAMDDEIGRVMAELVTLGLDENTIVVFTSDNGPESEFNADSDHAGQGWNGDRRGQKGSLYDGGVVVPCIVWWPGTIDADTVSDARVAAVDWLPTFTYFAGSTLPSGNSGENIAAVLLGQTQWARTTPLYAEWRFGPRIPRENRINTSPGASLIVGDWKYLRNRAGGSHGDRIELYNLATDPLEVDNVAADNPSVVASMDAQLLAWQATLTPCVGCSAEGNNSRRGP